MFKKVSLVLFVLISLAFTQAAFAQETTPESELPNTLPFAIESVTATATEGAPANIALDVVATWPTGCTDLPVVFTQTREGGRIVLEWVQEVALLQPCPLILRFFEGQILLAGEFEAGTYTIDLNGVTTEVQVGDPSLATPFPDVAVPADGAPIPIQVESFIALSTRSIPAQVRVSVIGTLPTGCTGLPIVISQRIEPETVAISISQITAPLAACPAMIVPYQELIPLLGAFDPIPSVTVNGVTETGAPDGEAQAGTESRLPIGIENAQALTTRSIPAQVALIVSGWLPTGCEDLPVETTQVREGNTVTVEIVQIVPENQMCTMMLIPYEEHIRLDGDFWGDTFLITVNGFEVEPLALGVE